MGKFIEVKRENLIVGKKYFFDDKEDCYGIFESRNELTNETVFQPLKSYGYNPDNDGKIRFNYQGDGFIPCHND